jgi:hypothetical protein
VGDNDDKDDDDSVSFSSTEFMVINLPGQQPDCQL